MPDKQSGEVTIRADRESDRPDIFLSYARTDRAAAAQIAEQLEALQFNVWWDKGIVSGSDWRAVLDTKIQRARTVLLYWSPSAEKSWWVGYEAMRAQQLDKLVIVSFDNIADKSQSWAKDLQAIKLRRPVFKKFWRTPDWAQLERDLRQKLPRQPKYEFVGWLGGGLVHAGGVTSVEFHPTDDDIILTTGRDGRAFIWSKSAARSELEQIRQENADDEIAAGQTPAGAFAFALGTDSTGRAWGVQRGHFSATGEDILLASEAGVAHLFRGRNFEGEPQLLSHLSVVYPAHDPSVRLPGQSQFNAGVVDAAIGAQRTVLTVSGGKAILWSPSAVALKEIQLPALAAGRSVECCFSPAVQAFFVTDRKGRVHRIDMEGKLTPDAVTARRAPGAAMGLNQNYAGRARGTVFCIASTSPADRMIDVYQAKDGTYPSKPSMQARADYPVRALAIHPDADVVGIASGYRPSLVSWAGDGQRIELQGEGGDHFGQLSSIAFSETGKYMLAGSDDGCVSLWRDAVPRS